MTQDELLAEAARTELDNLRDLEQMVALEEATRKKAMYKRSKYSGPMIRFHSKKLDDVGLVSDSLQLLVVGCALQLISLPAVCLQMGGPVPKHACKAQFHSPVSRMCRVSVLVQPSFLKSLREAW